MAFRCMESGEEGGERRRRRRIEVNTRRSGDEDDVQSSSPRAPRDTRSLDKENEIKREKKREKEK